MTEDTPRVYCNYCDQPDDTNSEMIRFSDIIKTQSQVIAELVGKLEEIAATKGMTLLSDCCVDNTCTPAFHSGERVGHCAQQWGVARAYDENAARAAEALDKAKGMMK